MPKIDIDNYIEQSGMRKARFGGYEPEDVHQAMEDLCADYEQHLTAMTSSCARSSRRTTPCAATPRDWSCRTRPSRPRTPHWPGRWISCKATAPISKRSSPP
ncbi:hypothetical protein NIA69_19415 [Gemmiger formicilis]|nr:hypothetical protein [Gemmiger formicilis]